MAHTLARMRGGGLPTKMYSPPIQTEKSPEKLKSHLVIEYTVCLLGVANYYVPAMA
jgi:hypothetical protein